MKINYGLYRIERINHRKKLVSKNEKIEVPFEGIHDPELRSFLYANVPELKDNKLGWALNGFYCLPAKNK